MRAVASDELRGRLARASDAEGDRILIEIVRAQAAEVLGHARPGDVSPVRAFLEMGFDSLAAVKLRNRIGAVTGVRLRSSAAFEFPRSPSSPGTCGRSCPSRSASMSPVIRRRYTRTPRRVRRAPSANGAETEDGP